MNPKLIYEDDSINRLFPLADGSIAGDPRHSGIDAYPVMHDVDYTQHQLTEPDANLPAEMNPWRMENQGYNPFPPYTVLGFAPSAFSPDSEAVLGDAEQNPDPKYRKGKRGGKCPAERLVANRNAATKSKQKKNAYVKEVVEKNAALKRQLAEMKLQLAEKDAVIAAKDAEIQQLRSAGYGYSFPEISNPYSSADAYPPSTGAYPPSTYRY